MNPSSSSHGKASFVTSDLELLHLDLDALGASSYQRQHLEQDATRARAAIGEAQKRGAGQPLSYAISLYNSPNFQSAKPKLTLISNTHALGDPKTSDEGERIWHSSEVDDHWRHDYLAACITAYRDGWALERPGDLPRYQPSDDEWRTWQGIMRTRYPAMLVDPRHVEWSAAQGLAGWAELWEFEDLLAEVRPKGDSDLDDDEDEIPF